MGKKIMLIMIKRNIALNPISISVEKNKIVIDVYYAVLCIVLCWNALGICCGMFKIACDPVYIAVVSKDISWDKGQTALMQNERNCSVMLIFWNGV